MEQKQVNIANLLKDCPKGTRLYSPICGEVELCQSFIEYGYIEVVNNRNEVLVFFTDGRYDDHGECLLFPSKEVRDWGCFRAKCAKGITGKSDEVLKLLESNGGTGILEPFYINETCLFYIDSIDHHIKVSDKDIEPAKYDYILSTGTELKLKEKEQPKFKVGDVVFTEENNLGVITGSWKDGFYTVFNGKAEPRNKIKRIATPEEIAKWNEEVLEPNHLHYSEGKRKIINWFLPFDRIVVRCDDDAEDWQADIFSHYADKNTEYPYKTITGYYNECLPYNDKTAKLIGTTDDYEEE